MEFVVQPITKDLSLRFILRITNILNDTYINVQECPQFTVLNFQYGYLTGVPKVLTKND